MPKKKKDRKKSGLVYDPDAKKHLKQQLRAFNWKRFGLLILSTLAAFAVLEAGITLEAKAKMSFSVVTIIYYVIVTALAAARRHTEPRVLKKTVHARHDPRGRAGGRGGTHTR